MISRFSPTRATAPHDQVCLAVRSARARAPDAAFALRRAEADVAGVAGAVGAALSFVLKRVRDERSEPGWSEALAGALVRAGGALERDGQHDAARSLFEAASELRPACAETSLHAGRAARQAGDREGALEHYARARTLDEGGRIARLARIGEAMLCRSGERRISAEIREAVRSGDREAAGVGLEARATMRCESERCREAIRDLCVCALRYPDREDQARAAEQVAMLLTQCNDLEAAREALLLVHEIGTPVQRLAARARLRALSAALGDVLGMRRWGSGSAEGGVPLALTGTLPAPRGVALPVIQVWRNAVERSAGTA